MNIGSIVSTVQSEPLGEEVFEIKPLTNEDLEKYTVLVNDEITPEIKEDIFA